MFVTVTVTVYYLVYYLSGRRLRQWPVLLAANIFFYLYASYKYALFIVFTIATIYIAAIKIADNESARKAEVKAQKGVWSREEKKAFNERAERKNRRILAITLIANFGILVFLKYWNFLAGGLSDIIYTLTGNASGPVNLTVGGLFLPLGISFYTFQATGYIIDVYRGQAEAERNPLKFALFVSFFPQIIQGPISEFSQLEHQLTEQHSLSFRNVKLGMERILWGLFKKLIIADKVAPVITDITGDYTSYRGSTILLVSLLYALQLYADFSGGMDISLGVAKTMGIDMTENFRRPYFSKSIGEYWRRWHITLGAWMKKYIFYSLAMSESFLNASRRMGKSRFGQTAAGAHVAKVLPTAFASFVVFLAVGLWHGANSKYLAFGVWNGAIIMISELLRPLYDKGLKFCHINPSSFLWRCFQMARTFVLVLIGYFFDIAPSFTGAMDMMKRAVSDANIMAGIHQLLELGYGSRIFAECFYGAMLLWIVSIITEKHKADNPAEWLEKTPLVFQWITLFVVIMSVALFGAYGPGYDATEFVYMQF